MLAAFTTNDIKYDSVIFCIREVVLSLLLFSRFLDFFLQPYKLNDYTRYTFLYISELLSLSKLRHCLPTIVLHKPFCSS